MMKSLWFALLLGSALHAQDIAGDWQGTLKAGPAELRLIVKIAKAPSGGWNATLFSIDQSPDFGAGMAADSVSLEGSSLKFTVSSIRGSYEGKISADGNSIAGTWNQVAPLPLELRRTTAETAWKDPSSHAVQFVTVDKDVKLEVLDWGGTGRPLVLLTGLGNTAHIYDKFAPKLTATYHVYGITRRGYGVSSAPSDPAGYAADRLGDDVLAVVDALKLKQPPVLVGHSIGGEELSSVGSRHPETVAGLIYHDAGYSYAYYDRARGDMLIDQLELQKKLERLLPGRTPDTKPLIREMLDTLLPGFERDLRESLKNQESAPPALQAQAAAPVPLAAAAIMGGQQKYTNIPAPVLAIYALPHGPGPIFGNDADARSKFEAREEATVGAQAKAFEAAVPTAHVVRLPRANHYVFISKESDVLREMNKFIAGLK